MIRIALLASCLLACSATVLLADDPAAAVAPPQVEQTVERAIGYLQTESAAWLGSRGVRRLPSRAVAPVGAG